MANTVKVALPATNELTTTADGLSNAFSLLTSKYGG